MENFGYVLSIKGLGIQQHSIGRKKEILLVKLGVK